MGRLDNLEQAVKAARGKRDMARDQYHTVYRAALEAVRTHANVLTQFIAGTATQADVDMARAALDGALGALAAVKTDLGIDGPPPDDAAPQAG